jgi:hypothetical protein
LWKGHINVQYVTQKGLENYFVKYLSKIEPTFFGSPNLRVIYVDKSNFLNLDSNYKLKKADVNFF